MYIDTHAHLYLERFKDDIDDVIHRATEQGVESILLPNIDAATVKDLISLTHMYREVCQPMIGLHPCSVDTDWRSELKKILTYKDEAIVAIGEIGIDLYWDKTFYKEQLDAFRYQIELAKEMNLPIVIHSRNSIEHTLGTVEEMQDGSLRGVFHCFTDGVQIGQRIAEVGFYMGIGGVITYKKNQSLRDSVSRLSLSKMVLETDAPYLPPVPHRGKRNESSFLPHTAACLGDIMDIAINEVAEVTSQNARQLFRLD